MKTSKEDPWDKIKSSVDTKSIFQMKKTNESNVASVPSNDDLNNSYEGFQNELESRGTHKKMKPVFETDSCVSSLSSLKSFDLEKIILK